MEKRADILMQVGIILCFTGVVLQFFRINVFGCVPLAPVVYGIGAVTMTVGRYFSPFDSNNLKIRRLRVQQCLSTILYIVAIYFMWKNDGLWIYAVLIASLIDIVVYMRTPQKDD